MKYLKFLVAICAILVQVSGDDPPAADHCDPNPCMNGGSCIGSGDGGYTCECQDSYFGVDCEIAACKVKTCDNGGTCKDNSEGHGICHCPVPYYGITCEHKGTCNVTICENGGTCEVDSQGEELCHCVVPYYGVNCEKKDPTCCNETDIVWVDDEGGHVPDHSIKGCGRVDCDLHLGRAQANGEGYYIPGKIVTADGVCHVASGGKEYNEAKYQVLTEPNGKKVSWVRADGDGPPACAVVCDPSIPDVYIGGRKPTNPNYGIGQVSDDILITTNNGTLTYSTITEGFTYLVCIVS